MLFAFFDQEKLFKEEKNAKEMISAANHRLRQKYAEEAEEAAAAKAQQKIDKKKDLKVAKNIRMTVRSKKADLQV